MFEKIIDLLIARRLKKRMIDINKIKDPKQKEFARVLNTLKSNKVMVLTEDDGIYVRMAGNIDKGECFSLEFGKVVSFVK